MLAGIGKVLAESVKLALCHTAEAMIKQFFLRLLIGIEMQKHHYQPGKNAQ